MHIPQDVESKKVEFDYAEFGMIGLETAYAVANTALGKKLDEVKMVESCASLLLKILNMTAGTIEQDAKANLTLFDNSVE
jgi:dihydroorotase